MNALIAVMMLGASVDLSQEIAAARTAHPEAFARVAAVRRDADALDAKKRGGRVAPLGRMLKQLGPQALMPMLDALLHPDAEGGPVTEGGRLSLAVGLLEAVGALRDERALPVLELLLDSREQSPVVTRAAADAYGFMQTDAVAARLVALSRGGDAHARAVREGMGSCRRVVVAQALGAAVTDVSDVREQVELARTLGDVGNAWAWKTPSVVTRGEENEVRLIAARALVDAFVRWEGDARQAASNALLVVDARDTTALINNAMAKATEHQRAALEGLQARVQRNPTR